MYLNLPLHLTAITEKPTAENLAADVRAAFDAAQELAGEGEDVPYQLITLLDQAAAEAAKMVCEVLQDEKETARENAWRILWGAAE